MERDQEHWDDVFTKWNNGIPKHDGWLVKYSEMFTAAHGIPVLDLGCGLGADSLYMVEKGWEVIACDISSVALARVAELAPQVRTVCLDLRDTLPFADRSFKIIVADLSLHYFDWVETKRIMLEIGRLIMAEGTLLLRVNSVRDIHYGAMQGRLLEPYYYESERGRKRFFDKEHLTELLEGWTISYMEETEMRRYEHPKMLWEAAAVRPVGSD